MAEAAAAQKRKRGAQDAAAEADTKYRRISFRPSTRAAPPTLDVRQCDSPDPSSEGGLTPSVASTPGSPSDRTASQAFPSSPLPTFET
ncbi:hypothetical protein DIPPA_16364 [Diplonema papillatum]|nr:hypothetical protein DIPPA_16364 [Diplonema papillatum]